MRRTVCVAGLAAVVVWFTGSVSADEPIAAEAKPLELSDGWGTITGQFVLGGDVPRPAGPLVADPPGGAPPVPNERALFDPETKGIANVVIYLRKAPAMIHPELKQSSKPRVEFKSENLRFDPRVLHCRTDQKVRVKSADGRANTINVSPFVSQSNLFNIEDAEYVVEIPFHRPEPLPVSVRSDLYPWMQAYWIVTDHPYVAITDKEGRFKIEGLPAGEHHFTVWHEQVGYVERKWTVETRSRETRDLPVITVPFERFRMAR